MQQVLFRIPTDSPWFLPIFLAVLLGAIAVIFWSMVGRGLQAFREPKTIGSAVLFLATGAIVGYMVAGWVKDKLPQGIPIYGYGMMLFLAFVACTWLASRLARREGIAAEHVQDLAIYLFVGGIVGSRVVYMIQFQVPPTHFLYIWEGGLVFYGGVLGGAVAYVVAYYAVIKKHNLSTLKLADIIAPCAALGLSLGRVGCLLNGCCYGEVACPNCPAVQFPHSGMPREDLVKNGYQTDAGFTLSDLAVNDVTVGAVEPDSAAGRAGLKPGDVITAVDDHPVGGSEDLREYLLVEWPRGKNDVTLTVRRGAQPQEVTMTFVPKTLGLHPTQLYETISTGLLLFLLLAYYPFRRHDGELLALFFMLYALHRFLNEMLRADNEAVGGTGLTLSQNGSIAIFLIGLVLFLWLRRLPAQYHPAKRPQPA
jgi:phosphatidylglycerol:prolipoprotein diacylglycerol transferase